MEPPWSRSIISSAPLSMANKKPRFLRSEDFPQDESLQRWFNDISDKLFKGMRDELKSLPTIFQLTSGWGRKATYRGHIGRRDCAIWNRGSQLETSSLQPRAAFHQHQRLLSLRAKQELMVVGSRNLKKVKVKCFDHLKAAGTNWTHPVAWNYTYVRCIHESPVEKDVLEKRQKPPKNGIS